MMNIFYFIYKCRTAAINNKHRRRSRKNSFRHNIASLTGGMFLETEKLKDKKIYREQENDIISPLEF